MNVMASKEVIEGIEAAALECPLCMERFTKPKLLPCIHTFCLECLNKWMEESGGRLSCPTCREICEIPTNGIQELKNNIFIIGLLDYVKTLEQKSAPTCACNMEACFFCTDCDELYCRSCRNAHVRMRIAKDHSIISINDYNKTDPLQRLAAKPINCSEHDMPFQFCCDTCKVPVCVSCIPVKHPKGDSHNIVELKDAFQGFSKTAKTLIGSSDKQLLYFRQMVKSVKSDEAESRLTYLKHKSIIAKQAEDLHRLIDRHTEDQMKDLESRHQQDLKSSEAQINDLEMCIAKLDSMRRITQNLLNSPNKAMALVSSSDTCEKFDKILNEETQILLPCETKYNANIKLSQLLISDLEDKLHLNVIISPEESTIDLDQPSNPRFAGLRGRRSSQRGAISITTRNASSDVVYSVGTSVKCIGLNRASQKVLLEEITVTDEQNGCYHIDINAPFNRHTLICLIIQKSDIYVNTIEFDKNEKGSVCQSHFQTILN